MGLLNKYFSAADVLRNIQTSGFTFDVESLGFEKHQPIYSASWADWYSKTPTTHYIDVTSHLDKASAFGIHGFNEAKKNLPKTGFSTNKQLVDAFLKKTKSMDMIVGHNLNFDYGMMWNIMDDAQKSEFIKIMNPTNKKTISEIKSINDITGYFFPMMEDNGGLRKASDIFESFKTYANSMHSKGGKVTVDTLFLSKLFLQAGYENKFLQAPDLKGNKLEFLAGMFNIDTKGESGVSLAHGEMDTIFNQSVTKSLISEDLDKLLAGNRNVSQDTKRFFDAAHALNNMSDMSIDKLNYSKTIRTAALEMYHHGSFTGIKTDSLTREMDPAFEDIYKNEGKIKSHFSNLYDITEDEINRIWSEATNKFTSDYHFDAEKLRELEKTEIDNVLERIKGFKSTSEIPKKPMHVVESLGSKKNLVKIGIGIGAAVVAANLITSLSSGYDAPPPQRISSKDDDYNTIEGLRHGGVAEAMRKQLTDFGSGYQGPNPQLQPSYNNAKDVYKYEMFRASSIGLSEDEMYLAMTEEKEEPSEYVAASANAGTAMHEYLGALDAQKGIAEDIEKLTYNEEAGISGHIDVHKFGMLGDYKSVSPGIFEAIKKSGKAKPMHIDQVTFYLGQEGMDKGFIQYINRNNPYQQKYFTVNFDPYRYERLIGKVEKVRARVLEDIASGKLDEDDLPKTASIERLREENELRPSVQEMAMTVNEHRKTFNEEMQYLRNIKRGMPTSGAGYTRIKQRKHESTQGIGLQIFNNNMTNHQYM